MSRLCAIFALSLYVLLPSSAIAQATSPQPDSAVDTRKTEVPPDPLGRDTPQGMVQGFIAAAAAEDYERASQYLNTRGLPGSGAKSTVVPYARQLQRLLDRSGWVYGRYQLSGDPAGASGDALPEDKDRVGTIRTSEGTVDLLAERIDDAQGRKVWVFAAETMLALPALSEQAADSLVDRLMPESLTSRRWGGVPAGHWLALLTIALFAYGIAWSVARLAWIVSRSVSARARSDRGRAFREAIAIPLRLYLAVWIFMITATLAGVSVVARDHFGRLALILGWIAFGWLLWRVFDAAAQLGIDRMAARGRSGALSAVVFFRRIGKAVLLFIVAVALLDNIGFDVTAGIAALGIGGIAIALGAQKTVENLVGSLTLIADQPIRVGDFCRFGDKLGTVEDIGMRSTRIRTLDRTIVTIPNGEFSSIQIENFAHRDRFWFHPTLALRYETTPAQIRYLLVELRAILYAHPRVDPDPARVRFEGLGDDALKIGVFAYVHATDMNDFLEVQEDLTLRFMDVVEKSGAAFAFPSRTIYVAKDQPAAAQRAREIEEEIRKRNENGTLQLPRFHPDKIAELRHTIDYPPRAA